MNLSRTVSTLAAGLALMAGLAAAAPGITVYKNEGCGCCELWIKYLEKNGFTVKAENVPDTATFRAKHGVPEKLGACHTAVVGGYAIEGHVPAREIQRLLAEKPKAKGLAVPGMPAGSPGMESDRRQPFDVLLVRPDGTTAVFHSYR
jgi:hypothetical protein